jgi:2-polyprenyl-6-methoxyphenol hydroxylase-like FAD-dependent oxidoreductase
MSKEAPLRAAVVGGGPVGLSFAMMLSDLMGARTDVTVYDGRWKETGAGVAWKTEADGNRRRAQVVTLQSEVVRLLPDDAQALITGEGSVMWPLGRASPAQFGPPRNIRLRDLEDRLLGMAASRGIKLAAHRFVAGEADLDGAHVLAIADGARSATREHYADRFGTGDSTPYQCRGRPFEDVVLAFAVRSRLPSADAVLLTVAQNRFLLNTHEGEGVLNMRLTLGEAAELRAVGTAAGTCECMRGRNCTFSRAAHGGAGFACATHGSVLKPSVDRFSPLWRRVRDGWRMFGIGEADVSAVTVTRVRMVDRPRFCAEIAPHRPGRPAAFGFLLGDAANAIHHWPGRGLNGGLLSAASLARCLASRWTGRPLRHADFARHEGNMHMLQYRHKARAWAAVVRYAEDGETRSIADDIRDGILGRQPRAQAAATFLQRLTDTRARLFGRMEGLPDDARLEALVAEMSDETLSACVASGPWDSWAVGGEEVDISAMLPPVEPRGNAAGRPAGAGSDAPEVERVAEPLQPGLSLAS